MSAVVQPAAPIDLASLRTSFARGQGSVETLAAQNGVAASTAAARLAACFAMEFLDAASMQALEPAFDTLPLTRAQQQRAIVLRRATPSGGIELVGVVGEPFDGDLQTRIEHLAGDAVVFALSSPADIHAVLNQHEANAKAMDVLPAANDGEATVARGLETLSLASATDASSPAVRLVSSTLYDALRSGASDVHLESTAIGLSVKYRIDGVLDGITQVNGSSLAEQVISRLKVLCELDIAERRVPQDGSFRVMAQGRQIDLRVSIMPSVHGEDAVVRILDKQAMVEAHGKLTLDALGFDVASLRTLRKLIEAPHGMLLVTGPTGSGKTTTLYAALSETQTGRDKVITIEDPVEYQLPGVLQIPVNEKKGLTFAKGLRSILRHDPDKIMVGEIRDRETAEIAVQSALTGHLVLTTVHANNVFDVFGRFLHMGLDPYAVVSALNGIWAQRLLRVNCARCSQPYLPEPATIERLGLSAKELGTHKLYRGAGCGDCRGTGYRGRLAVAEVLKLDDELRELIVDRQPMRRVKEVARRSGTVGLLDAALQVARDGRTTLEEVRRVAHVD